MRTLSFDGFVLSSELRRDSQLVQLEPKPLAVLRVLLEHGDRRVSIDELRATVWRGAKVEPTSVHVAIGELRKAIAPVRISCKQGAGYQLHAEVVAEQPQTLADLSSPSIWRYYAAHSIGSVEERIAAADALTRAEAERFGA